MTEAMPDLIVHARAPGAPALHRWRRPTLIRTVCGRTVDIIRTTQPGGRVSCSRCAMAGTDQAIDGHDGA